MPDRGQQARAISRGIDLGTRDLAQQVLGLIEWTPITSVTATPGVAPTATTDEGETVQVLEPYGLASAPPGGGTALCLAPGADTQERVVLGVSSLAGRPGTAAGDTAVWTVSGHKIVLENDGDLTITSKEGATVTLATGGGITITAGTGTSVTINVDTGQSVNIGGLLALALTIWPHLSSALTAMLNAGVAFVGTAGDPAGLNAGAAFAAALAAFNLSVGANSPMAQKAKGE